MQVLLNQSRLLKYQADMANIKKQKGKKRMRIEKNLEKKYQKDKNGKGRRVCHGEKR